MGRPLRKITLEGLIRDFKGLAAKIGEFDSLTATAAGIWSTNIGWRVNTKFNQIKKLAGLQSVEHGGKREYTFQKNPLPKGKKSYKKIPCLGPQCEREIKIEVVSGRVKDRTHRLCDCCRDKIQYINL